MLHTILCYIMVPKVASLNTGVIGKLVEIKSLNALIIDTLKRKLTYFCTQDNFRIEF